MSWTDERIELLKQLWADGLTASQIATQLGGGVTRNAVIGKVHRLNFSSRTKPQADPEPAPRRVVSSTAGHRPPRPALIGNTALKLEAAPVAYVEPIEEVVIEAVPDAPRLTLLELTDQTCKWPIGDPSKPDFYFCGHRPNTGMPYCARHARIAYQPVQDRRRERRIAGEH